MSKTKQDLALSLASQLGFKLMGFCIVAMLARHLSQDDFGRLTLALSICTLGVMFTDLGYNSNTVRKIASDPDSLHQRLGLVLSLRIPLLVSFYIFINTVVWLTKPDLLPITLGIALSVAFKDFHGSYAAVFIATRRIVRNIVSFGVGLLFVLAGVAFSSYFDLSLKWIVVFYALGGLITLLLAVGQFKKIFGSISIKINSEQFKRHVFSSFMLFALTVFNYAHFAVDNIALGYLRPYEDVAIFAAAAQLLEASQFAIRPIGLIMFPICALLCTQSKWIELSNTLVKMYGGALLLGIAAWIFVMISADLIISVVFSSSFAESADVLRALYASVPALFITSVGVFVSASLNRERFSCIALCTGLVIKLCLFPFVVPHYGPIGVAWLNFFTQSLIACWLIFDSYWIVSQRRSSTTHIGELKHG